MKSYLKLLTAAALSTVASSCSTFLDINSNPNSLVSATPDAILAQALTVTAANYTGNNPSYNSYGSWVAGYWGKSGVVSGYGEELTYNYSTSYYSGLFNNTYDNLQDYQLIQTQGVANGYPNHAAIARIMKVYDYLLLVDEYGAIPYFEALQGSANTAPSYDDPQAIYADLIKQLTGAVADINAATSGRSVGAEDVVFGGDMKQWKRFANSLKLRILLRESQTNIAAVNTTVTQEMQALQSAADGFITADVVVQPTYAQNAGQQNPFYNRYGYTSAGTSATERQYQIPTQFILNQYLNNNDPRLTQFYVTGYRQVLKNPSSTTDTTTVTNPEWIGAKPGEASSPSFNKPIIASRFLGSNTSTAARTTPGGFFKGLGAPTILMMLSEHLFSKAEAETRGLLTGGDAAAATDYQNGLVAAFQTAYRTGSTAPAAVPADPSTSTATGLSQYRAYISAAANATNPLVNFNSATSNGALGKQAIIIYQKYLALNTLGSIEAWDDYRRTALPKLNPNGDPVSIQSSSPRADKLPTRLLYPLTEYSTNSAKVNATGNPNQFTKIFWDVVD